MQIINAHYIFINCTRFTLLIPGKKGDSMYFIEHGMVDVQLNNGKVINSLGDGSYFGGNYRKKYHEIILKCSPVVKEVFI